MTRFAGIESLRGVAAGLVLYAHLWIPIFDACGATAPPRAFRATWGAFGVDLFFVISGFVIALTLDRPGINWRSFLAARIARVAPIYFVFTAVCLAIPPVVCVPVTANVVADSFAFLPVLDADRYAGAIHPYGWTLSFEIWFYVVATAAAVVAGPRVAPGWMIVMFLAGPFVLIAIGYAHPWYFPRFALSPLVIEFALGCVAYRLTYLSLSCGMGVAALTAGLAGLFLGTFREDRVAFHWEVLADPGLAVERVVYWGLPSFLLVAGVAAIERRTGWWPGRPAAAWFGGISYSLYLVQPIVLFAVGTLCKWIDGVSPWAVAGAAVTGVFVTAAIVHRVVEKPVVAGTRRRLERWLRATGRESSAAHGTAQSRARMTTGEVTLSPGR
jgi:peptidoglycan/LPS O-acetylase OafA/YrhL